MGGGGTKCFSHTPMDISLFTSPVRVFRGGFRISEQAGEVIGKGYASPQQGWGGCRKLPPIGRCFECYFSAVVNPPSCIVISVPRPYITEKS